MELIRNIAGNFLIHRGNYRECFFFENTGMINDQTPSLHIAASFSMKQACKAERIKEDEDEEERNKIEEAHYVNIVACSFFSWLGFGCRHFLHFLCKITSRMRMSIMTKRTHEVVSPLELLLLLGAPCCTQLLLSQAHC